MTVLSAMQSAAIRLIGRRPPVFFTATGKFEQQICDLVNEAARDIAEYQDWQGLVRLATFTGTGAAEKFARPADYDRMLVHSDVADPANWLWGYGHVSDINEYLFLKDRGWGAVWPGIWTLFGDKFHFFPVPAIGQEARFPYITRNVVRDAQSGGVKPDFTRDDDTFILPENLLTLWLVWRWRENNKLDFSGDQEAFMAAISAAGAKDGGSRIIRKGGGRRSLNTRLAWPWPLGGA